MFKQLDILKSACDAQSGHVLRCLRRQFDQALGANIVNFACCGRVNAADQVKNGGLTRAVGSDQGEHFTRFDVKTHVVDRQYAAKAYA